MTDCVVLDCGGAAVHVEGDGHDVDIDGLVVMGTPGGIEVTGKSRVTARRVAHISE